MLPGIRASRSYAVLLLTENTTTCEAMRSHLLGRGFAVEVVEVGGDDDWLTAIQAAPPGAVVLDYAPATERGWELVRALKADPTTQDVPVLFCAFGVQGSSVLQMDYLTKPVTGGALAARAQTPRAVACRVFGTGDHPAGGR